MRLSRVLRSLSMLAVVAAALPASAQVEPNLRTVTDLSDNYQQVPSKSETVCLFDFTPTSRAVYEPYNYLTTGGRMAWIGRENNGQFSSGYFSSTVAATFNPPSGGSAPDGKAMGLVFGLRVTALGVPQVRLYWWPQAQLSNTYQTRLTDSVGGAAIIGTPMRTKSDGTVEAIPTDVTLTQAQVIAQTTHVRFSIHVSNTVIRTIDVPCPWKIWDSPSGPTVNIPTTAVNYQRSTFSVIDSTGTTISGVKYDPWSESLGTSTPVAYTLPSGLNISGTVNIPTDATLQSSHWVNGIVGTGSTLDTVMGNFVYTPDYFAYIFGGKAKRLLNTDGSIEWASDTSNGGYAVGDVTANAGWLNGLPNATRYQGLKMAVITGFLKNAAAMNLYYRFLDMNTSDSGNATNREETKTASDTTFGGPDNGAVSVDNQLTTTAFITSQTNRLMRHMTTDTLSTTTDNLQIRGPRNFDFKVPQNFSTYDSASPDPNIPQPLNYALADTYRQMALNEYGADRAGSCGSAFLLVFPGQGMNDSYATPKTSDVAHILVPGNAGGNGNGSGSFGASNNSVSLAPTSTDFFAGVESSIAAFGTAGKSGEWGQPWTLNFGGTNTKIQTMAISVGVPGAYHFKNTNSGKVSPHENLFLVPQWGDPNRAAWSQRNGQPAQQDLPIQIANQVTGTAQQRAKVFYWVGADPQSLADAVGSALGYIVGASAALSAPATPATGVRSANEAYFGTFKTSLDPTAKLQKFPLWSGRLYGVGILISSQFITDPVTGLPVVPAQTHDVFSFYGYDGTGNNGTDPTDLVTGIPNYDNAHLWDSYDIFGKYTNVPSGSPVVHTTGLLNGSLLWSNRTMYTLLDGARVKWPSVTYGAAPTYTPTVVDPNSVISKLTATVYDWDSVNNKQAATLITSASATQFAAWVRGAYDAANVTTGTYNASFNRQDIMGDIVNSAPLAVELTPKGTDVLVPSSYPSSPFTDPKYFNPHARLLIVGTNVGQLECFFEWAASYDSGKKDAEGHVINYVDAQATELWSFIPPDFWQALYNLYATKSTTGIPHSYMVDGDPALYHVDLPPSDPTKGTLPDGRLSKNEDGMIIFGSRKGARSYYGIQISSSTNSTPKPDNPVIKWLINPQDPAGSGAIKLPAGMTAPNVTDQALIQTMGMSTSVPAIATVNAGTEAAAAGAPPATQDLVFLGGGYSNPEVDARYYAVNSTTYGKGMGKLILGLDPITGKIARSWDLRDKTGSISEGVTPVRLFTGALSQRLYFADTLGSVWAINGGQSTVGGTTAASGYRLDSPFVGDWISTPRPIYMASTNLDASNKPLYTRFTTRPDAFRLQGGFPLANADGVNPLTVVVAIGSGDRNNPTDKDETYKLGLSTVAQYPPHMYRFMVFADRQDSSSVNSTNYDSKGIPDSRLQSIPSDGTGWATSYSDDQVTPGTSSYLFKDHDGYYVELGEGTLTSNAWTTNVGLASGLTFDKVLVSPLIKQGLVFFSIFDILNASGFNCSANAFTRTFRQCDIMRPLALDFQTTDLTKVGDIQGSVSRTSDSCSGLAFYFNSISSQLVDAGDRVVQGGALSAGQGKGITESQTGQNTPSIQNVKDTDVSKGIRVRAWRVVR